ncbi:MAG TPA: CoA pyrophosphatase [Prolixibacteraceae bacterium]|nr:CoA pyrophosphatase [Prolixibacteraceae bacterium]
MLKEHKITKVDLQLALNEQVDVHEIRQRIMPLGRINDFPQKHVVSKQSAVMMLFYNDVDKLMLCLTKRSEKLNHHPGQISFPGGQCDVHELAKPLLAALRETNEEIGIGEQQIEVLGKLSELYVPVSNFTIHPYVGWMEKKPVFNINEHEVEQMVIVDVDSLLNPLYQTVKSVDTMIGKLDVPCFLIDDYLIWGATSMMIAELEAKLMQYYSRRAIH